MNSIDEYLKGRYTGQKEEIRRINDAVAESLKIFDNFFIKKTCWPYEITEGDGLDREPPETLSQSTASMILFMLGCLTGRLKDTVLFRSVYKQSSLLKRLSEVKSERWDKIFSNGLTRLVQDSIEKGRKGALFQSESFGPNDPFTLVWVVELILNDYEELTSIVNDDFRKEVLEIAKELVDSTFQKPNKSCLKRQRTRHSSVSPSQIQHAFPLLRVIQLNEVIEKQYGRTESQTQETILRLRTHLLNGVHQHLSFYAIADSSFDVAELVFFLEGLLIVQKDLRSVGQPLLERIFSVIQESQKRSTYWRPLKPYAALPTGLALLPLSVEVANSLLRICRFLDEKEQGKKYFSTYLELFERYSSWLLTRVVTGKASLNGEEKEFCGWYSEHVQMPNAIHPWETSQVILFLEQYSHMLQEHIGKVALEMANLTVQQANREKGKTTESTREYWNNLCAKREPSGTRFTIYKDIGLSYLLFEDDQGTTKAKKQNYSMLLYGPPGTGKTGIAEDLVKALKWKLVTVSPSDFISGGEAEVETRAKRIFRTLEEQRRVVILFDEIDRLILDRDSKSYGGQSDIFQFMTPGMLVKIKELRKIEASIFIVATNYEERIDAAMKRPGRIDKQLIVLPPDMAQRVFILKDRLKEEAAGFGVDDKTLDGLLGQDEWAVNIAGVTALASYEELKQLVVTGLETLTTVGKELSAKNVERAIGDVWSARASAIRLSAYESRFKGIDEKDFPFCQQPFTEFLLLAFLKCEPHLEKDVLQALDESEKELLGRAMENALNMKRDSFKKVEDDVMTNKLKGLIRSDDAVVLETLTKLCKKLFV